MYILTIELLYFSPSLL